jgi:predicted ATPase
MIEQGSFLEHISIQGYRRLLSLNLEMRPLAVIVGANGVGKTSLLEVFSLLATSAKGQLESKISEYGGLNEILTRDKAQALEIKLRMSVPRFEPLEYDLQIIPRGQFYGIGLETLTQEKAGYNQHFRHIDSYGGGIQYYEVKDKRLVRPNWEHSPFETSLSQVPKMFAEPESLRQKLASCTFYGALNVLPGSPVRLPQPMRPVSLPGANGEDLVACLYYLRETDADRFEVIEDTLKSAFPDFEKLNFPPVAAGTLAMTWKDSNFSQPFYMNQLSEGTLRFLWLTTLLLSRDLTAITLIDEPEVSLHPQLLSLLADLLREASQRTQLIVATHADRLVRALQPNEILVADQEDGVTSMKWGDAFDLERWLADYTMDELWSMNIFGGRS